MLWEWQLCLMDTQVLDCTKVVPEEHFGIPTTKKGQQDTAGTHMGHLLLNLPLPPPLSLPPLTHNPFPISVSTSRLLLNEICSIDFSIWSHLHLNSCRGISWYVDPNIVSMYHNIILVFEVG